MGRYIAASDKWHFTLVIQISPFYVTSVRMSFQTQSFEYKSHISLNKKHLFVCIFLTSQVRDLLMHVFLVRCFPIGG